MDGWLWPMAGCHLIMVLAADIRHRSRTINPHSFTNRYSFRFILIDMRLVENSAHKLKQGSDLSIFSNSSLFILRKIQVVILYSSNIFYKKKNS